MSLVIKTMSKMYKNVSEDFDKSKKYKPTVVLSGVSFMNEFVDKDGNVFHKGKEQPELKGTLPPTRLNQKRK